jgi:hypothetical protein
MSNWFIRAITKDGKKFITELYDTKAILIFKQLYDAAEGIYFPINTGLSQTWEKEIFMQFMDPNGVIIRFELCHTLPIGTICVLNMFWFNVNAEERRQLKHQHPVGLEYTFDGMTRNPLNHYEFVPEFDQEFDQDEMSSGWHMGYYHEQVKEHEAVHAQVLKERDFGCREVVDIKLWDLPTSIPKEEIALTFEDATGVDLAPKAKPSIIVEGSIHNHDWCPEPAIHETQYRIYINGHPSDMIVDDISFMLEIHKNAQKSIFSIADVPSYFSMGQPLFDMLERFLRLRDFKIGAHRADQVLEDGNDAIWSIFWGQADEVIYVSPLKFDDVNL